MVIGRPGWLQIAVTLTLALLLALVVAILVIFSRGDDQQDERALERPTVPAASPSASIAPTATPIRLESKSPSSTPELFTPTPEPLTSTPEPTALPEAVWLKLLSVVPDTSETRFNILMNDYARFRDVFGISVPDQDASIDGLQTYRERMIGPLISGRIQFTGIRPVERSGFRSPFDPQRWNMEVGYNLANIDQDIVAGPQNNDYVALEGRFDMARVTLAISTESEGSGPVARSSYKGMSYYTWGDDGVPRPIAESLLSPGQRLAISANSLLWTSSTVSMERMIDVANGDATSLANVEELRLLAEGLSRLGAFSALIAVDSFSIENLEIRDLVEGEYGAESLAELEQIGLLRPYTAVGVGAGGDTSGTYAILILVHRDSDSAEENAGRLAALLNGGWSLVDGVPWSEKIDGVELQVIGTVLDVKLDTSDKFLSFNAMNNLDSIVLSK